MKKYILLSLVAVLSLATAAQAFFIPVKDEEPVKSDSSVMVIKPIIPTEVEKLLQAGPIEEETTASDEEVRLLALLTMAEAEGECEIGQRLVIDTVLNRVDDPHFPDTIHGVIYQRNQYTGIESPRVDRCWVKEELVDLVRDELKNRTSYDVIFFRTKRYSSYGEPLFQVGHHYFSSYD